MNMPKAALLLELGGGGNLFSTLLIDRRFHIIKGSYNFPIIDYGNLSLMKWLEKVTAFGITRNMFLV